MILFIGNNTEDYRVLYRTMEQMGVPSDLHLIADGDAARVYVHGCGGPSMAELFPTPSVIFIESEFADGSGWELLEMIKTNESLRWVPVVMVVHFGESAETRKAYAMGAGACLRRPICAEELRRLFTASGDFAGMTSDCTTAGVGPT
jgi:CheY-like chemotaxis protein